MSDDAAHLIALLRADATRMRLLAAVEDLCLPDCWIGAGFVRALVWDHLHGRESSPLDTDVDVVWWDPAHATAAIDRELEGVLTAQDATVVWSVTNQARMHGRNSDEAYASTEDALRHWPETATAVAIRQAVGRLEILAPFGLADLFAMTIRPTPAFRGARRSIVEDRVRDKRWRERWPQARWAARR
jgi:hypothetical protein